MALATQDEQLTALVEQQVEEVLARRYGAPFTSEHADLLEKHEAQIQSMLSDDSMGRILNGPLWLSGASVVDGTVTAAKLTVNTLEAVTASTGTLNVTGTMTAAASYPALTGERITITSTELAGYNSSDAKTFQLGVDGSGFIGIGGSKLSWDTAGVVTVPAAAISSLTIADVGSGTFNSNFDAGTGRVRAGTALERVELTSAGLSAYDTGGTETFSLSASTGSLSHTGTYTIRNASSGARIEISNIGIKAYNASNVQTFELLTTNGSGFIGSSPQISFGAGSLSIPGGSLAVGSVTANKLSVSTLSAITADLGTITAGSITAGSITADTIDSGSLNGALLSSGSVSSGAVSSLDVGKLSTGTISSTTITLGSGGSIVDADGSTWDQNGIVLNSSGSFGDVIKWQHSGVDKGSIYASSGNLWIERESGAGIGIASSSVRLYSDLSALTLNPYIFVGSTGITLSMGSVAGIDATLDSSGNFETDGYLRALGNYLRLGPSGTTEWAVLRDGTSTEYLYFAYGGVSGMRLRRNSDTDFDLQVLTSGTWTNVI